MSARSRQAEPVVEMLVARFDQDPAVVRRDVEEFIASLEARSLLVREEA